ncbi:uncharacterized protein LOC118181423 isoform X3 [Stegodyphus dumicola]|uniref:uncharacterized protein LOC118181423 isoform X3 n=1 Tax=Stegodyphus dumicola TaxID=202533 RepID=UPI0015A898D8|nr:uncharacterized protein LOC118181423 isoform X3 [Stegodyphus dumicola]
MGLGLLALTCLVGAAFAGPFARETSNRCSLQCSEQENGRFSFEVGKKYVYRYRGGNYLGIAHKLKQNTTIRGLVEIHVLSKCELVLKLKEINLEEKATAAETRDLIRRLEIPVPFAFDNGKIENVCPSPEEVPQSLNIKKGILSTLINTMSNPFSEIVKEDDSLGTCVTKYTAQQGRSTQIRKEKNLKSCTQRHSSVTALITSPYDSPNSNVHAAPIFPGETLICTQDIERGTLFIVSCVEEAELKPLKEHDDIIKFEGVVELVLSKVENAEPLTLHPQRVQESLKYNLQMEQDQESSEKEVEQILQQMCSKNIGVVDVGVSKSFFKLISLVKKLQSSSLDKIYNSLKDGKICSSKKVRHIFLDTLPMAGTEDAIELMIKVLVNKEISGLKAKVWPASLALIPKPTERAVAAVIPLLRNDKSGSVLLGVSVMVYRFCAERNCERSRPVQEIVSVLNQAIGSRCSSEKDKEVISLLKAFGNMGFVGEAESNILACAKDSDKPVGLRLAAIDAFRRLDKKRPQGLLKLYEDQRENFEIRIAAVSSIMKKADAQQIEVIKRVAEQENDVQVSSYISTLMTNIKKSSSPLKKNVRKLLREMEIQSPPVGYLENSKNIEVSAFSETFNIGGEVEADIIHCSDTKIPRSINTRFDVNVFDKNINLFEFGVRAEGLEAAFKKILGRKDASKQKSSAWNLLRSRKFLNDEETEVSLFVRTMNTEIFDLSASDLTGVGEMVKIADVMEKLAEGKSVDFSHSFLFLNTHLIIPSVTGRSYTFGLTGSATVGLTATQKLDVLQFPRRADIQAHFQPSVNVEVAATVGIQTSVPRPDMRVVTRLHLESDTQAQFRIKDGRQVLARFNVPSENVVFAKISSDIFEVDAQQNEKRVFKAMQKKIDYCFNKLEKPLGVSICGKWEVPRPFLTRTFPFIRGVGSVEFAVKKSDQEMKGLELSVEIPKRLTEVMHYKASLDTPGSQMSRRFAAELEVQQPDSKQMKFSLDLTSPFKNARATGSYNLTPEVVSGALELHTSSSQIVSINVSSEISETRSRKVLKTSLEVSVSNRQPVIVEGIIDITKGRKQQISLDLKSNKPTEKPISIQGMIIKEGRLDLQNSEWKMTSDVKVKSPFWNTQVLLEAEKQTKQTQTLSTSVAVHYQKDRLQKQTIKLAGKLQRNSNKVNTYIQFETTQYPAANWNLNWNFQGKLRETMKNDISLKYGGNPERTYVNVLQSCRSDGWRNGEFQLSVKAPQLGIDNDVKVSRVLEPQNIKMEANIRYKADRRIKTLINLDKVSEAPVQIKVNAELEYPGRKLILQDEIVEISPNAYQGDLVLQWQQDKQAELKYKYQNLNKESKYHQEIEASLRLPNRQNQIKSKATFQLMQDSLYLENQLILNRNSQYLVRTHLKRTGVSHMDLKTPKIDAKLKLINDDERKAAAIDVKFKTRRSQHITATVGLDLGQKTKVEIEATLDADRRPYKKFYVSAEVEKTQSRSGNLYKCSCKLECSDILNIQFTGSGDLSVLGKHDVSLDATVRNLDPIKLIIRQELTKHFIKTSIKVSKRNIDKALIELEGAFQKRSRETEISTKFSLKALDSSFETKELEVKYMFSRTSSSSSIKSEMRLQRCPGKVYAGEIECDMKSSSMQLKASAQTPHINFEKQSLSISFQRSNSAMLSIVQVQLPNRKEMSISSDVKKTRYGLIASSVLSSPFEAVRNAKVLLSLDTQAAKNSLMTYIDVNEKRVYDMELRKTVSSQGMEMDAQVKIPCRKFQSISLNMRRVGDSFMSSCNMELEKNKPISLEVSVRKGRMIPVEAKISLQYAASPQKVLTLEIQPEGQNAAIKLYSEDRKIDAMVKFLKDKTENEDKYGYEWRYKSKADTKRGGVAVVISQRRRGIPMNVDVLYYTTNTDLRISGRSVRSSREAPEFNINIVSKGEILSEISIRTEEKCAEIEIQRRGPFMKCQLCINKRGSESLKLISLAAFYRERNILDFSVEVDSEKPRIAEITLNWNKDNLLRVLEELKNIAKFFYDRSLSEIEEEIIKHIKDFWYNVIKPKLEDFLDWYQEQLEKVLDSLREALSLHFPLWDEIVNLVKDLLSYLKTFLKELPHIRSLKEFLEDLKKFWDSVIHRILGIIFEHVPDVVKDIWQMTRADLKNCLEKICRPGSICDDLRQIYENSKAKGVLNYLLNKISEKRRSLMELLPQGLPDIKDLIRKAIRIAESQIKRIFGDLVGEKIISVVKGDILEVESFLRGRVIELIDNIMKYIDDLLESDEDLQLLKSVMQETKQNAVNAWQNREKIAREMWQPVRVRDLKHTLNNG